MSSGLLSERVFFNGGLAPVADGLAGTVDSDYVSTKHYARVTFVVIRGVATGGTADHTFTVRASSDNAGTGATAIPFKYRQGTLAGVLGAVTAATTAGYTNTAGSNRIDVIEVDAASAADGKPFVNLRSVEVTNDPVVACILTILHSASYEQAVLPDPTS